jgi:hypothetical protein
MARTEDTDQEFIHNLIALAGDIITSAQLAKSETDDPDILYRVLLMESAALIIQKRAREYQTRLAQLKQLARADLRIAKRS